MSSRIILVDGYNVVYRLFYAVPSFTLRDGTPVNAVYGLAKIITALIEEKPDALIFVWDSRTNLRKETYAEYKATRDRMPDQLRVQEPYITELLSTWGVRSIAVEGYEADDIIGTLARQWDHHDRRIEIISGDKDLGQLVSSRIVLRDPTRRDLIVGPREVRAKFGVDPEQIVDYLAITGDSSDNIPWIPTCGPKKAVDLLTRYRSLADIYDHLDDIKGKTHETLQTYREQAMLSYDLASLRTVPMETSTPEQYPLPEALPVAILELFERMEFRSLLPEGMRPQTDWSSLGVEIETVSTAAELRTLTETLLRAQKAGLATWGEKTLSGVSIYTGTDRVYSITVHTEGFREWLTKLMTSAIEIIGSGLKEDLRRIRDFIEQTPWETADERTQTSLF